MRNVAVVCQPNIPKCGPHQCCSEGYIQVLYMQNFVGKILLKYSNHKATSSVINTVLVNLDIKFGLAGLSFNCEMWLGSTRMSRNQGMLYICALLIAAFFFPQ